MQSLMQLLVGSEGFLLEGGIRVGLSENFLVSAIKLKSDFFLFFLITHVNKYLDKI